VSRDYFNEKAAIWDEMIAESDITKLEIMAGRLDIKPGVTILDVGTGTGIFIPFLLNKIGENGRLIALDIAEEMLKRSRAKRFNDKIEYVHADVANVPLCTGAFSAVVCYSTFPHFRDKPRAVAEMARVLKNGGSLFICHTSGRSTINSIHQEIPAVRDDIIPVDRDMRKMLSTAGFTGITIDDRSDSYLVTAVKS